ncbi:MAG: type II secretion system F family protein [Faecalibacterium sp.]
MFGLGLLDFIFIILGALLVGAWIFFYVSGKKNASFFESLEEKDYPLKELYFVGYAILEYVHFDYKSKAARELRKQIEIIYDSKYADYYLRVLYAQKITLAFTVAVFAVPMYCLADDMVMIALMLLFIWAAYYYYHTQPGKKIVERSESILIDFSGMVSKLALLVSAGMILREAWEKVSETGDTPLYLEMQKSVIDMKNGFSEQDAIFGFGQRCMTVESKKFASTIIQGVSKGNSELVVMLQNQSKEMWEMKKQLVRRQGELANTKLIVPACITFIGILIMVVVPIFANLGV